MERNEDICQMGDHMNTANELVEKLALEVVILESEDVPGLFEISENHS